MLKCNSCGKEDSTYKTTVLNFLYKGNPVEIKTHMFECSSCGHKELPYRMEDLIKNYLEKDDDDVESS